MKLILIMLLFSACTKAVQLPIVHLTITNEPGRMFFYFTFQGVGYTPGGITQVITDKYKFDLPANEESGYIIPAGYTTDTGKVVILSAINQYTKLSY